MPPHGHGTVERLPCHLVPEDPHNRIVQTLLKSLDMGNSFTSARQPSLLPVLNLDSGVCSYLDVLPNVAHIPRNARYLVTLPLCR